MFKFVVKVNPASGARIRERFLDKMARRARAAALYYRRQALMHAPERTGWLKREIYLVPRKDGWDLVASAPHAAFVEFGTIHQGYRIPPNPFMRRARSDAARKYPDLNWSSVKRGSFAGSGGLTS
jgi:hypothetical protein